MTKGQSGVAHIVRMSSIPECLLTVRRRESLVFQRTENKPAGQRHAPQSAEVMSARGWQCQSTHVHVFRPLRMEIPAISLFRDPIQAFIGKPSATHAASIGTNDGSTAPLRSPPSSPNPSVGAIQLRHDRVGRVSVDLPGGRPERVHAPGSRAPGARAMRFPRP